ncbi:MAG: histidine triad nucleotide-binding protein [Bacillota bacterium]
MQDCLFCKMVQKQIPVRAAFEDETVLAFHDIAPQAPVHILVIPKKHFRNIMEVGADDGELVAHLFEVARALARENHLEGNGFRLVVNTGRDGGQTVEHLHIHLLGGRGFGWPPG